MARPVFLTVIVSSYFGQFWIFNHIVFTSALKINRGTSPQQGAGNRPSPLVYPAVKLC